MILLLLVPMLASLEKVISTEQEALSQGCLKAHNEYRTRHGAPPLAWSGELAEEAQNWANHLAAIDQMERDSSTKEGENIFYMYGGDPSEACDRAVENWYSEVKNYDFKNPRENPSTDHFSQVVWKKTKVLGVGTAHSKSGNFFLVARYNPKGDTDGAFLDNVNNALDVLLTLNPKESQDIVSDKPKNTSTYKKPTHKADDSRNSEPVVNITTTASPGPSVPMAIANASVTGVIENQPSLPLIFENNQDSKKEPAKDVGKMVATTEADGNHGNGSSQPGSHDNTSPGSPPKSLDEGMKVKPPKFGKDFQVELRFPKIQFTDKMGYPSSKDSDDVRIEVTSSILQLYEEDDDFQEVQLIAIRNGSVITTLGLIFAKEGSGHLDKLTSAVAVGRLGNLEMSRDYVAAGAVAEGFLKLSLPRQPLAHGHCPQPCSNPTHCFNSGCHVSCCSFRPTPTLKTTYTTAQHTYLQPLQPSCPGSCDATCLPQCTSQCCLNKTSQQDFPQPDVPQQSFNQQSVTQQSVTQQSVTQPEVNQPEVNQPEVNQQEVNQQKVNQPEDNQPEDNQPEDNQPEVNLPEVHLPKVHLPEVHLPEVNRPGGNQPEANQPDVNQPKFYKPEVNIPEVHLPEVHLPEVHLPEVHLPEVNRPGGNQPEANQPNVNQPEVYKPDVNQPEVNQQEVKQPEVNNSNQGYSCPATCPFSCYPQCTPECCSTPFLEMPDCSDDCADFCSVDCPQDCCSARKSGIHNAKHLGHSTGSNPLLPPLLSVKNPKLAYMFGSKPGSLRNPTYGKGFAHGSKDLYDERKLQAYINKLASYKKSTSQYANIMQRLTLRAKGRSLKNPLSFKQMATYSRPAKMTRLQRKLPYKKTLNSKINKARYTPQTTPGMQAVKNLHSHGAPLDIKFAYRYGNRLLVPIDMPNMDIKELQGRKFISVPAFKRGAKKGQENNKHYHTRK